MLLSNKLHPAGRAIASFEHFMVEDGCFHVVLGHRRPAKHPFCRHAAGYTFFKQYVVYQILPPRATRKSRWFATGCQLKPLSNLATCKLFNLPTAQRSSFPRSFQVGKLSSLQVSKFSSHVMAEPHPRRQDGGAPYGEPPYGEPPSRRLSLPPPRAT